jgi:nucleoside-diphosphate-sugar epimerase
MVAGATGAVGLRLVRQLLERGHQVIGTSHRPERLPAVKELGAEALMIDGLERRTVGNAVVSARPDAIVNEMTALTAGPDLRRFDESFALTNRLRTLGTRYLLDAAITNGVGRFVVQSYTGWDNEAAGGSIKTEEHPLERNPPSSQRQTLAAIVEQERMVLDAPLTGTVLRYGNLYGPGASDDLIDLVRRRALPVVGGGRGIWSWLHIEDAAAATVAALERGQPRCLQHRRRPPRRSLGMDPVPGGARRRSATSPCAGLAGEVFHRRGGRALDDAGARIIQREGQARIALGARLPELARWLSGDARGTRRIAGVRSGRCLAAPRSATSQAIRIPPQLA